MIEKLEPSIPFIVRVKGTEAIGLGFLVDDTHIITCAHVVKDVLNLDGYPNEAPSDKVTVEFPFIASTTELQARVLVWHPRTTDGGRINDIAVLVIDEQKPQAVPSAQLIRGQTLFDHAFWAFGYTAKYSEGIWSHGKICVRLPNGRLQIENPKAKGLTIEHGFSGSPVWDEELNGVVGMIVEASLTRRDTGAGDVAGAGIAFVIPIDVLVEAWPDLEKIAWPESKDSEAPQWYTVFNEGVTLSNLGRNEEALARFDKALEIDPHDAVTWNNKGVSLFNLGRYEGAIACYDKALEINPRYELAWYNKGFSLNKVGRNEEAIACYDKALEIDPSYDLAWNNKGLSLYNLGRYVEALTHFDKALEIDPNYKLAWYNKGSSLDSLGRYVEALGCFDKALEIDPHDAAVWNNKGLSLHNLGRNEEALAHFDKALEIEPQAVIWNNKALSLYNLGRYEEAIACCEKALEADPNYKTAWHNKVFILEQLGRNA